MILHLIETGGPGGAEQMLLRLAERYADRGHDQLICLRKRGWLAKQVESRGFKFEIVPADDHVSVSWFRKLRKIVKQHNITAIHSHEFLMNVYAATLGKMCRIPVVSTVHGQNYYADKFIRRALYVLVSHTTDMVAVSGDLQDFLETSLGRMRGQIHLIPNGIDVPTYANAAHARDQRRAELDISDPGLLISNVGSYYDVKGQCYLIEAIAALKEQQPHLLGQFKVVIAGQGPLEQSLKALVAKRQLADVVNVIGYVENIPELLAATDIFALPSLSEGLPLSLLEASASNTAIVASRVGGIPELIREDDNGLLVPPKQPQAIADALVRLIESPQLRERLAHAAKDCVTQDWSFKKTVDAYLELLQVE